MSIEVLPLRNACNLKCTYCYEEPLREREEREEHVPYDMGAMLSALDDEMSRDGSGQGFTIFGGEPLLVPLPDLERLLRHSYEKKGRSGVQTNGALVTDAHVDLFKKYKTHVGFSIDGPEDMNDARWAGSVQATRTVTARSQAALERLLQAGVGASLIVTLHRLNVGPAQKHLGRLVEWLRGLAAVGLKDVRLHLLEVDSPKAQILRLDDDETVAALITLHRLEPQLGVRFDMFREMLALLRGRDEEVTCIWNACDPGTTGAVRGVGPRGERLNCGRTNKDGISWLKSEQPSHMRQVALYQTPQKDGGCAECRFFIVCKGQCPGEAIGGDPRNRSANCQVWFRMFSYLEQVLVYAREQPVSLRPDRKKIEQAMLREWTSGNQPSVARGIALAEGRSQTIGGSNGHADVPHGDQHGDHWDNA